MSSDILLALKQKFGLSSFREGQEAVISALLRGESGLLVMPTGGGKSLCYQLPSELLPGTVLVVSPLIALMKDQVDRLRGLGFKASYINSTVSREEREKRQAQLARGELKILYVTPERFRKPEFMRALLVDGTGARAGSESLKATISLLAIDEAHCISQWGHDFRPEYARLGEIRRQLGSPLTLALTATATPEAQREIREKLKIDNGFFVSTPLRRDNLQVQVLDVYGLEEKIRSVVGLRHQKPGPMIIYFSLISTLYKCAEELAKLSVQFDVYHGQLNDRDRRSAQERFLASDSGLMLATPAFGLGVDKPNVRQVVHFEVPSSIEAYFQEIGRAGRDGAEALCSLLYDPDDVSIQMDFLKWANPDANFIRRVYQLVVDNPLRVQSEGEDFLRGQMNFYNSRDFRVETALALLRSWDILEGWKVLSPLDEALLDSELREARLRRQNEKLLQVIQWVKSDECRMVQIYQYFGEGADVLVVSDGHVVNDERIPASVRATADAFKPGPWICGVCDNCLRV